MAGLPESIAIVFSLSYLLIKGSMKADLGDCQGRAPLLLQDVQAYRAIRIDVGVVNLRLEVDLQPPKLTVYSIA